MLCGLMRESDNESDSFDLETDTNCTDSVTPVPQVQCRSKDLPPFILQNLASDAPDFSPSIQFSVKEDDSGCFYEYTLDWNEDSKPSLWKNLTNSTGVNKIINSSSDLWQNPSPDEISTAVCETPSAVKDLYDIDSNYSTSVDNFSTESGQSGWKKIVEKDRNIVNREVDSESMTFTDYGSTSSCSTFNSTDYCKASKRPNAHISNRLKKNQSCVVL